MSDKKSRALTKVDALLSLARQQANDSIVDFRKPAPKNDAQIKAAQTAYMALTRLLIISDEIAVLEAEADAIAQLIENNAASGEF
jgi:hypothetical protein